MTPSIVFLYCAAACFLFVVLALSYIGLPHTPRRVERELGVWISALTIAGFALTIAGAAMSIFGH